MLNALKAVYAMLKTACESHDVKRLANEKDIKKYQADIASLRKENDMLIAEQDEAIKTIAEITNLLNKY